MKWKYEPKKYLCAKFSISPRIICFLANFLLLQKLRSWSQLYKLLVNCWFRPAALTQTFGFLDNSGQLSRSALMQSSTFGFCPTLQQAESISATCSWCQVLSKCQRCTRSSQVLSKCRAPQCQWCTRSGLPALVQVVQFTNLYSSSWSNSKWSIRHSCYWACEFCTTMIYF